MFEISKFLEAINVPRHIKRYYYIKKIERHTNKKNRTALYLINFLILVALLGALYYIFVMNLNPDLKRIGWIAMGLIAVVYLIYISLFVLKHEKCYSGVSQIILRDEDGKNVRVWELQRKTAVVIGKSTEDDDVDIDLTGADYALLVSKQHAVLNFSGDDWYIEDIGSTNGSGIKRYNERSKFRLEEGKPYKLHSGDIIYIANTKMLVK